MNANVDFSAARAATEPPQMLRVTLIRGTAGKSRNVKANVRGLGLRRTNHTVFVIDTPSTRGMIRKVQHMLDVGPADPAQKWSDYLLAAAHQLRLLRRKSISRLPDYRVHIRALGRYGFPAPELLCALYSPREPLEALLLQTGVSLEIQSLAMIRLELLDESCALQFALKHPTVMTMKNPKIENAQISAHAAIEAVRVHHRAADRLIEKDELVEARSRILEAFNVLSQSDVDEFSPVWGEISGALGQVSLQLGNPQMAINAFERALSVWARAGDTDKEARAHLSLAMSYHLYAKELNPAVLAPTAEPNTHDISQTEQEKENPVRLSAFEKAAFHLNRVDSDLLEPHVSILKPHILPD